MCDKTGNERGSIMVEVIAVIALMGIMGTMMFRQVQQRNLELDNINMASEIRMVKEATTAYIQANKTALEVTCDSLSAGGVIREDEVNEWKLDADALADVEVFLPDNWKSEDGNGVIDDYDIYMSCYIIDPDLAPRKAIYGTIIPKEGLELPLKRAARVANLIGSDGGVRIATDTDGVLHGTMGAWEIDCPTVDGDNVCEDRQENFYVATTGMDVYIPDASAEATQTVLVPQKMAFSELHSASYFSVGGGSDCVETVLVDGDQKFLHEIPDGNGFAQNDNIRRVGTDTCEPLFWVGTADGTGDDKSAEGQVYIKNGLFVGRDNAGETHAVAVETGSNDLARQITVYSTGGDKRLILNASGQIVGRSNGTKGYRLDAATGEIVLFDEVEITVGSGENEETKRVQIPVLRLKDGAMETGTKAPYDLGKYKVDPAYTSVMNDIRLVSRGGAKLSEILPDYIAKGIHSIAADGMLTDGHDITPIGKPTCPTGYVRAIMVTPVSWGRTIAGTTEEGETGTADADPNHTHDIPALNVSVQESRVQIEITDNAPTETWTVDLTYDGDAPDADSTITALAQTYCVFDADNFDGTEGGSDARNDIGIRQEAGSEQGNRGAAERPADLVTDCTNDWDCVNTERCVTGKCTKYGACSVADGAVVDAEEHLYCVGGEQAYIECFTKCETGTCINYRCVTE